MDHISADLVTLWSTTCSPYSVLASGHNIKTKCNRYGRNDVTAFASVYISKMRKNKFLMDANHLTKMSQNFEVMEHLNYLVHTTFA